MQVNVDIPLKLGTKKEVRWSIITYYDFNVRSTESRNEVWTVSGLKGETVWWINFH